MASRRSQAASHSRNYFISLHPPIANVQSAPCPEGTRIHQKPTASSEGAQLWDKQSSPPSLGSAKRDRLSSSTSYGMRQSPFGELYGVDVSHVPTAALLRSLQCVSWYRSRFAEPAAYTQSACICGCVTMAGRHSLLGLYQPRCGITLTVTLLAYTLVTTVKMFAQKKLSWLLFVKYDNLVYIWNLKPTRGFNVFINYNINF